MSGLNLRERAEAADKELVDFKASLSDDSPSEDIARMSEMAIASMEAWNAFNADQQATAAKLGANATPVGPGGVPLDVGDLGDIEGQSGIKDPQGMTVAQAFVKSPAYQEVLNGGGFKAGISFESGLNAAVQREFAFREGAQNALIYTGDPDTAGITTVPARLPGIVDAAPALPARIRSLCNNLTTDQSAVEWVRITSKAYGAAVVEEAQSEATIGDGTGGTVLPAVGGLKPSMDFDLELVSTTVKTIAVLGYITVQQSMDSAQLLALLRQLMLEDVAVREDAEIVNGTGGATSLDGLLSATWGITDYTTPGGQSDIAAVLSAIGEIVDSGFAPNAIAANPADWHSDGFLLSTNSNGDFILADPQASIEQLNRLWGLQVVTTPTIPQGSVLVGDYRRVNIWDRMRSRVDMTDANRDLFERNILTLRAEERLALGVAAPEAFRIVTPA